jgi:hypothetical protein
MRPRLKAVDCLWVRSPNSEHPIFMPVTRALEARGAETFSLRMKSDAQSLPRLQELLRKTDKHVVLHGLLPHELRSLKPILADRRNFSVALIDWWTSPWWYTQHADYLLFNLYNGIALRMGEGVFGERRKTPLLSPPEARIPFHLAAAALRPFALIAFPFREVLQRRRVALDQRDPASLLYFPISVNTADQLPGRPDVADEYDFSNTGATYGIWHMRDAYAPARYDFANIYVDRERLIDGIKRYENNPYRVFDRRGKARLSWAEYCGVVHRSRYAIATGGLHDASIPKYLEYVAMGTPILGRPLPYECPLLRPCIFTIDTTNGIQPDFKSKLDEALSVQPTLREQCLAVREKLFQLYDANRIVDLLQDQLDGKPIPSDYIQAPD